MSNWKTNFKTLQWIGFLGFIVIFIVFSFLFKNEKTRYFLTRETKVISKEDDSLEYFLAKNSLDETFDKIKNKKYDELDFADKMTVKSVVKKYSKDKYKHLSSNGKELKLKDFLKDNDKIHDKISSDKDEQLTALISFYKVVIDKDESYAKYLDQKTDEEKLSSFTKEREKEDNYMFIMLVYQLFYTNIVFIVYFSICNVIFDSMLIKYGSYSE